MKGAEETRRGDALLPALALGYLACHALLIGIFKPHAQNVSYALLVAAPLLAAGACLLHRRHVSNPGAPDWLALAAALLLWAGGMAASWSQALATGAYPVSMLLYVYYGVPLVLAAASSSREPWPFRLIDGTMALILGWLFFAHTVAFASLPDTEGKAGLRLMLDIENIFIAGFACIRYLGCDDPDRRAFFHTLAVYACAYLLAAFCINHFYSEEDFGGWSDLIVTLPFLLLFVLAGSRQSPAQPALPVRMALAINAGSPLILPLTLLATSALTLQMNSRLAVLGFVTASLGYGLRSVLSLVRAAEERNRLDLLAHRDPLTGLPNRRQFEHALRRAWSQVLRQGDTMAVLMIDIDHFKALNDTLGHTVGDERLREVAGLLAQCAPRSGDLVARYGGEEFVAVLPGCPLPAAQAIAETMRAAVEAQRLPAPGGIVTVSIGVGGATGPQGREASDLVGTADAALYDAKNTGRNRVATRSLEA